jgi:hypothetical protein
MPIINFNQAYTNCMEQSYYRKANSRLANQDIHYILWNPEVSYCVYKRPTPPVRSEINPLHIFTPLHLTSS